ncbi:hypothetical protein HY483_01420 [Candidatus Woesearchaeota archaeon]|nr:hypothetical protein [Candidatus Woesearchaeota archaeon]
MAVIEYRDKILSLLKLKIALLPAQVATELRIDSMIASAMLSEMSERGLVKVSRIKIGSSPLYYDPSRPEVLEQYIHTLKQVEREALQFLKNSRIVRDGSLSPVARVAFQGLKDYAVPLDVTIGNTKEVFWKWYLIPDDSAEKIIVEIVQGKKETEEQTIKRPEEPIKEQRQEAIIPAKKKPGRKPKIKNPETQQKIVEEKILQTKNAEDLPKTPKKTETPQQTSQHTDNSQFSTTLKKYFAKENIKIIESNTIKEGKEYDLTIQIQTPIGIMRFYCKAKEKKKINDADLSVAYVEGQSRKMPVLYATTGTLDKGLEEQLEKKFKGLLFKTL